MEEEYWQAMARVQELERAIISINEQLIQSEGISVLHFYNENAEDVSPELACIKSVLEQ